MSFFAVENPFKKPDRPSFEKIEEPDPDVPNDPDQAEPRNTWVPPVDILENRLAYIFLADLPGLKAGDIRVVRINGMLLISGERNWGNKQRILRQERSHGYFCRRLPLPADASRKDIRAGLSDGVLQITVRKLPSGQAETDPPERLEISVHGLGSQVVV